MEEGRKEAGSSRLFTYSQHHARHPRCSCPPPAVATPLLTAREMKLSFGAIVNYLLLYKGPR